MSFEKTNLWKTREEPQSGILIGLTCGFACLRNWQRTQSCDSLDEERGFDEWCGCHCCAMHACASPWSRRWESQDFLWLVELLLCAVWQLQWEWMPKIWNPAWPRTDTGIKAVSSRNTRRYRMSIHGLRDKQNNPILDYSGPARKTSKYFTSRWQ